MADERTATAAVPVTDGRVGLGDRDPEVLGDGCGLDRAPYVGARRIEGSNVIDVDVLETRSDLLAQPAFVDESGIRWGADDKARRHRQAGSAELAEVRALAAGEGHIRAGELVEAANGSTGASECLSGHDQPSRSSRIGDGMVARTSSSSPLDTCRRRTVMTAVTAKEASVSPARPE